MASTLIQDVRSLPEGRRWWSTRLQAANVVLALAVVVAMAPSGAVHLQTRLAILCLEPRSAFLDLTKQLKSWNLLCYQNLAVVVLLAPSGASAALLNVEC